MHQNTFSGPFPENIGDAKALGTVKVNVSFKTEQITLNFLF